MKSRCLLCLTMSFLFLCSCQSEDPGLTELTSSWPEPAPSQQEQESADSPLAWWDGYRDLGGELIPFTEENIGGITLSYATGWNMDLPGYQKIRQGDQIAGFEVGQAESSYKIEHLRDHVSCISDMLFLESRTPFATPGILVFEPESMIFYPYYDEEGKDNFLHLERRSEGKERRYAEESNCRLENLNPFASNRSGFFYPMRRKNGSNRW